MSKYVLCCGVAMVAFLLGACESEREGRGLMKLTSPEFEHEQMIPSTFTCQGKDVNPFLRIEGVPGGTKSLVLIMDDPDAPIGTWDHWLVYNISPDTMSIREDSVPGEQGTNSWGRQDYGGPCPPSGTHRYYFKLYALSRFLEVQGPVSKQVLEQEMKGSVLEETVLMGRYKKN